MSRFSFLLLALVPAAIMFSMHDSRANSGCDYMQEVISKPQVQKEFLAHYRYARELPLSFDGEMKKKNDKLMTLYKVDKKEVLLDKQTVRCLECHGDMLSIGTDRAGREVVQKNFHAVIGSHALGLDYFQKARELPAVFLEPDPNRNNVIFIGGKLGCLSCHNPFSKRPFHLNASEADGTLCQQCHRR